MEFYNQRYKRQYFDDGLWVDSCYDNNSLIVIANSLEQAKEKIEYSLKAVEDNKYRAVPVGDIAICIGLNLAHGYDSFSVTPIK